MADLSILMAHPVFHANIIPFILKTLDPFPKDILIFLKNRICHHVKPAGCKFLLCLEPQDLKRRPVNT